MHSLLDWLHHNRHHIIIINGDVLRGDDIQSGVLITTTTRLTGIIKLVITLPRNNSAAITRSHLILIWYILCKWIRNGFVCSDPTKRTTSCRPGPQTKLWPMGKYSRRDMKASKPSHRNGHRLRIVCGWSSVGGWKLPNHPHARSSSSSERCGCAVASDPKRIMVLIRIIFTTISH